MMKKSSPNRSAKEKKEPSSLNLNKLERFIFASLIFLLPTQLGLHFWPDFSYVNGIRIDYLSPTLYLTDILVVILFLISFLNKKINLPKLSPYSILLILVLITGALFSKEPLLGMYGLIKAVEIVFAGYYFYKNADERIIKILSFALIYESIIAFAQFIKHGSIGGPLYLLGERAFSSATPNIANANVGGALILRPYGTLPHPNVLAAFILLTMISILIFVNSKNLFYRLCLIIGTGALIITLSRAAIIVWVAILPFFLIKKKKDIYLLILIGGIFIVFLIPFIPRFTSLSFFDQSVAERVLQIRSSLLMIKESPFFGVGLNNYLTNLPKYFSPANNYFSLQPVHNIFLFTVAEVGILAGLIIAFFFYRIFRRSDQNGKLIILVIGLLGLFDHYFLTLQQGQLLLALMLALTLRRGNLLK